jgi:CheY-like chemotaxis protein
MGRRIMTDAGYEVITVNNGSAALKKIHESHPDLIVLDVYMPGYGGLEVCQRLKESEATMKIPVLLTVGKMEPFKVDEAKRVRADGHIIKPFDASELLSALTKLEDKIVPSENGRGRRGKAETKKSRPAVFADPAAILDDAQTEQIAYLARVKQRSQTDEASAQTTESPVAEPAAIPSPAIGQPSPMTETPQAFETSSYESSAAHEENAEAVTFASGPIYELEPSSPVYELERSREPASKSAEEFEIQSRTEPEYHIEAGQEIKSTSSAAVEMDAGPSGIEKVFSITQPETVTGLGVEPGLVPEAATHFEQSAQAEPAQRWVAENVAHTSEEGARSLEEEMQQAHAASEPSANEPSDHDSSPQPTAAPELKWQPESVPEIDSGSGAAFAAAASVSQSFSHTDAVSPSSSDSEPPSSSEASAAWDNWQRIRDSIITERATEAIAESAAAMADAAVSAQNDVPAAEPAPNARPSNPASNNDALANIVDNVLAELKPRLLAEIAKQLANDKK